MKSCIEKYYMAIKKLALASLITNLLLGVGVVIAYMLSTQPENRPPTASTIVQPSPRKALSNLVPRNGTICAECDVKNVDVKDTLYDSFVVLEDDRKLCCLENHHDIQNLILGMIREEEDHEIGTQDKDNSLSWFEQEYAAHLYIDRSRSIVSASDHGDHRLRLKSSNFHKTSFVNKLEVDEHAGTINISTAGSEGVYFIYSAVTYDFTKTKVPPLTMHMISRTNIFGKQFTVQMLKFGGSDSTPKWKTSFLCCTVTLGRNEKVSIQTMTVNTRNEGYTQDYIHDGRYSNYFGMFKV